MNKKTDTDLFPVIAVLIGFIAGACCGILFCIYSAGYLLEKVNIDKVDVSFNETEAVEDESSEIIPRELKPSIKEWFKEIIKALPNRG